MKKTIVCAIASRKSFNELLDNNTGLIILKFGANWCGPCLTIKKCIDFYFANTHENIICCDIDIDESFDVYAFLKHKKMVNGIPALLCYKKGNTTFIPDDSVTGSSTTEIDLFFKRCESHYNDVCIRFPGKISSRI